MTTIQMNYCNTLIDLPNSGKLDIRYGPQNRADGDTVDLPKGIDVQWRLNNGPRHLHGRRSLHDHRPVNHETQTPPHGRRRLRRLPCNADCHSGLFR